MALLLTMLSALTQQDACPAGWTDYMPSGYPGLAGKCFQIVPDKTWGAA